MSIVAIRGFKDILPEESSAWRRVEDTARSIMARYGVGELRVPVVEKSELFARGIGEATDIVEKEIFTFPDRHGEPLTLRPEATAGIVRAVLEHHLAEPGRLTKFYHIGPMFRYERPQKGRQRQFHQLDVEYFGDPGPYSDAELIVLLNAFLTELGLTATETHLNSLGCPECRPVFREKLAAFFREREENLCPDCRRRLKINPLRIIDCKVAACQAAAAEAPRLSGHLCRECRDHLAAVEKILSGAGVDYVLNPKLVRGLDYYSRTAFEVLSGGLGSQNAVAGGGRYDGLSQTLGGPPLPGLGFAVGLERLVMLLNALARPAEPGPDFYLALLCPEALEPGFILGRDLRARGRSVTADWESGSLKSRLKKADKLKARRVIMLGGDELARGVVTVRDMVTKEQQELTLAGAAAL